MLRPPALDLPDQAVVRWTSFTKIIRLPEQNWPAQICERPIIAGQVGNRTFALIAEPEAAKTILGGSEEEFPRWRIYERVIGGGPGRGGLLAATGPAWRRQRRAFSPMFRPEHAGHVVPLVRRATERAMDGWRVNDETGRFDILLEMTRLALDIIWRVLFDTGASPDPPAIVDRAARRIHAAHLRGEVNEPVQVLADLADEAARRTTARGVLASNPFDGWGLASDGCSEDGLTRQEIHDNAREFLGAGHGTMALALTWALWLTAQDPESQQRIHAEIDRVAGANPIEDAHSERLAFTSNVLRETMRLFPPGLVTVRQSRGRVVLAGEQLPAGTVLAVCIYALHRHRNWWDEPDLFRPDRFVPGAAEPRHRYAYLPFSAGRHACIGAAVAWKEAVTIFATILQHFRVTTDAAVPVRPRVSITLRPDREVPIVLHPRR